jgi:hypothetical protein
MAIDLSRITSAAVEAALDDGRPRRRLTAPRALVAGAALAVAARYAMTKAPLPDLASVPDRIRDELVDRGLLEEEEPEWDEEEPEAEAEPDEDVEEEEPEDDVEEEPEAEEDVDDEPQDEAEEEPDDEDEDEDEEDDEVEPDDEDEDFDPVDRPPEPPAGANHREKTETR